MISFFSLLQLLISIFPLHCVPYTTISFLLTATSSSLHKVIFLSLCINFNVMLSLEFLSIVHSLFFSLLTSLLLFSLPYLWVFLSFCLPPISLNQPLIFSFSLTIFTEAVSSGSAGNTLHLLAAFRVNNLFLKEREMKLIIGSLNAAPDYSINCSLLQCNDQEKLRWVKIIPIHF